MNTIEILDSINKRHNWTDYRTSVEMEISRSTVSAWRRGISGMNEAQAIKAAEFLEVDAADLFLQLKISKSKSHQEKRVWQGIAKRLSQVAMLCFIAVLWGVSTPPVQADPAYDSLYIIRNIILS